MDFYKMYFYKINFKYFQKNINRILMNYQVIAEHYICAIFLIKFSKSKFKWFNFSSNILIFL